MNGQIVDVKDVVFDEDKIVLILSQELSDIDVFAYSYEFRIKQLD